MSFYLRLVTSVLFFITIVPLIAVAVFGLGMMQNEFSEDPLTFLFIELWTYAIIPMTLYIGIFTKFDNPFKKKQESKEITK